MQSCCCSRGHALGNSGEDRHAFVAQACGDNEQLRRKVEALIAADENPDSYLERPALRIRYARKPKTSQELAIRWWLIRSTAPIGRRLFIQIVEEPPQT